MLTLEDAEFILELVNQPQWLVNIGDKQVGNIEQAQQYIQNGPQESYLSHGFGLYLVKLKASQAPIGVCGLIKRDELEHPDIGYAISEAFYNHGYATESAAAVLSYAKNELAIQNIVGVTSPNNHASRRVLEKIGLEFKSMIDLEGYDEPSCLYIN